MPLHYTLGATQTQFSLDTDSFRVDHLGQRTVPSPLDRGVARVRDLADGVLLDATVLLTSASGADCTNSGTGHSVAQTSGSSTGYSPELAASREDHAVPCFLEKAGPRDQLFFDPAKSTAAIVTCGGLCPGLNNVIRAIALCCYYRYGVRRVIGIPYGYDGMSLARPESCLRPDGTLGGVVELTPAAVKDIHKLGGSILGSSRGRQSITDMVDFLQAHNVQMLFTIGGDGTQKGAAAIHEEARARGYPLSVVGVPKTIDNDLLYVERSFGFDTAVELAQSALNAAHEEARGYRNGIGLVRLMGRDSGFIALHAALASADVNVLLLPEVTFKMEWLLDYLESRLRGRPGQDTAGCAIERPNKAWPFGDTPADLDLVPDAPAGASAALSSQANCSLPHQHPIPMQPHCLIVVSEGAGQNLMSGERERDPSGNVRHLDIGLFLKEEIAKGLDARGIKTSIKYIDPSYMIRAAPANPNDALFCTLLAHNAVHAALAGKTNLLIGKVNGEFVHVPIHKAVEHRRKVDVNAPQYQAYLNNSGQPFELK
ncbi:hypothetical protein H696_00261 [Fonticula alba]|uniref:Phosphofructokinase domain-containing protein n=1 Tax=Fonticula alba TaxID=691883 RepID=A0A058ZFF1_FONAL|nr:hypothetical protein H696_00261 [Fonticula alba]KCV72681.1 hypothetical protein H696_00261 [Fonticula alba]|eukprot:XP_009492382.1 hypothetical protein H696_00261 [Fonticula alba]